MLGELAKMPADLDTIELLHKTSVLGQDMINRYYFRQLGAAGTLAELAGSFISTIIPAWAGLVTTTTLTTLLELRNLNDDDELLVVGNSTAGARSGAVISPFFGAAFQLLNASGLVRTGRKTISGLSESDVTGTSMIAPWITNAATYATAIATTLNGLLADYEPVMYSPPNLRHPIFTVITPIVSAAFNRLSSQNSRKTE